MNVYAVYFEDTDECTYSCKVLHRAYARLDDAETEVTRLGLITLKAQELRELNDNFRQYYYWYNTLADDGERQAAYLKCFWIDEIEVIE